MPLVEDERNFLVMNYHIPKFRSAAEAQKFIVEKRLEQKKLMNEYQ